MLREVPVTSVCPTKVPDTFEWLYWVKDEDPKQQEMAHSEILRQKHVIQGNGKATHAGTQRRTSSHLPRGSEQVLLVHMQTDLALTLATISEMQVYWLSDM